MFPPEIAKPTLVNTMLVEISETAFRNSHAADQQRLLAARLAYRSGRGEEIVDLLKDADGRDPNVAFMRGLGLLVRGDEASVKAGEAVLRTAAAANHTLAKVLLGRVLVTAPKGITKNVDEGRRLIEAATATGDPQAQRVAAIAYISAEFGSFDPGRAASLFKQAAEAGDPQAMFHYARVLSEGIGVPASQADAMDFLGRAAAAGLTSAQFALGSWQLDQYGANALSDPADGVAWLERAMQRGFSLAGAEQAPASLRLDGPRGAVERQVTIFRAGQAVLRIGGALLPVQLLDRVFRTDGARRRTRFVPMSMPSSRAISVTPMSPQRPSTISALR